MDKTLIAAIIGAVVIMAVVFYLRGTKQEAVSTEKGLTLVQALGAGIVGLGILLVALPWAAGSIAVLDFIESSDFAILTGSVYALGILALLGGLVLIFAKGSSE